MTQQPTAVFEAYLATCECVTRNWERNEYADYTWEQICKNTHDEVEDCLDKELITPDQAALLVSRYPNIFRSQFANAVEGVPASTS